METDFQRFLDELRSRLSIADVVGAKVKLVRKGREFSGLCPFHNEKTPSFTVNEAKGFYHCFGCGAHGDVIKFEMEANNLPFIDAITKLGNKAGLKVPQLSQDDPEETQKKASWYEIVELACGFFEKNLRLVGGKDAADYLARRGVDEALIKKFRLGYAPDNNGLKAYLLSKNVSESDMIELGLATLSEKNGKIYDFFRNRMIVPIMDRKNRVIAFGGRVLDDGQPKYLNSPETPIFNKRQVLYNLNFARDKAFEARKLVICEGYMDVIAQAKFGFDYAVAPLGTALTEEQILQAWKVCPEPTLCFDGDTAGIRAAIRSIDRVLPILKAGYSLKYVFLPDKMDPDDFLKAKGALEYAKILEQTVPLADMLWRKTLETVPSDTPEQKAMFEKTIKEEVGKIADEQVRNYYLQDIKKRMFERFSPSQQRNSTGRVYTQPAAKQKMSMRYGFDERVAKFVVAAMFCYPELIGEYEEKVGMFELSNGSLSLLLNKFTDIYHQHDSLDSQDLYAKLAAEGFSKYIDELWEIKMIRQQPFFLPKVRLDINNAILEMQFKQLEKDCRECMRIIETDESVQQEVYERYDMLKKEQQQLLKEKNIEL